MKILHIIISFYCLFAPSCSTPLAQNKSQIAYSNKFSEKYKKEVIGAKRSAEKKISEIEGKRVKLLNSVLISIEDGKSKDGLSIGGTSTFMQGVGSKISIYYVDSNLFNKLEHEFAHAILNSNDLKIGHSSKYDNSFYNWKLSRKYGY